VSVEGEGESFETIAVVVTCAGLAGTNARPCKSPKGGVVPEAPAPTDLEPAAAVAGTNARPCPSPEGGVVPEASADDGSGVAL
jgi:hypothetical protein